MAPAPNSGPNAAAITGSLASIGVWRLLAVAAPHLAALAIMLQTETDFGSRIGFMLSWGILNFLFIAALRRPALSGALASLPNFVLPGDVSASKRYWKRDLIQPEVETTPHGTIVLRDGVGFGYDIDMMFLDSITVRRESLD
jgi:L-alanine-DL-glutamate epimerase-like enolase superfamily enzyme